MRDLMAGLVEQRGGTIEIVAHDLDGGDRHDRAGRPEAHARAQDRGARSLVLVDEHAWHRLASPAGARAPCWSPRAGRAS